MKESAAILAHFDMNGDGRISFEEFVNGMRRIGGSARERGGLLSASPLATDASFPNGRKEYCGAQHRHSGEQGADGNATGEDETAALGAADADERGEENATDVVTGATTAVDEGVSHRPSEPAPLQPQSPAEDVGSRHHAVETPDDAPHATPVQGDSKVSRDEGGSRQVPDEGQDDRAKAPERAGDRADAQAAAAAAARLTVQVVGEGLHKQSVVGTGSEVAVPGVDEGGARLEGQGCGCVLA